MKIWLPLIRTATGAEVYTRRLAEGLTAVGHEVLLDEVPQHYQYYPWLAPISAPKDLDVIVANSWNASAFWRRNRPLVTVVHLVVHEKSFSQFKTPMQAIFHRFFVKPMERMAINRSQRVIAVSRTAADSVRRCLSDKPISVVLNGVNTDFFTPDSRWPFPSGDRPIELLFVGTPSRRKGFDLVAKIVEGLGTSALLTCIGPEASRNMPRPPGRYLGYLSSPAELRQAYRQADLLLFPSRLEGAPYVVAEALACGLPVISVKGTAVEEIAPPPDCGMACEPEDVTEFIQAVRDIADNPSRLQAMRESARAYAVAHLNERRWITETEAELYAAIATSARE